jgi:sugar lactone lactonase YvrE
VFRVSPEGEVEPFLADIVNPTALAIGPDKCLYVTSRHLGIVYRSTYDKQVDKFAGDLGVATGLAFDSAGNLIVGDRNGKVYRIHSDGEREVLCTLEPSVSAYHIAVDETDSCFISGPTLSTRDSIYRVSPRGAVSVYFRGFGRPQGMAFDRHGNLQVAASYKGRKGIFTIRDGVVEQTIAAPMLIGLAYDRPHNRLYIVNSSSLFVFEWATHNAMP